MTTASSRVSTNQPFGAVSVEPDGVVSVVSSSSFRWLDRGGEEESTSRLDTRTRSPGADRNVDPAGGAGAQPAKESARAREEETIEVNRWRGFMWTPAVVEDALGPRRTDGRSREVETSCGGRE
jgi:hypothetical protein